MGREGNLWTLDPIFPRRWDSPTWEGVSIVTPAKATYERKMHRLPTTAPMEIWAMGMIMYIMLTGVHPSNINGHPTVNKIKVNQSKAPLPLGWKH